ncbi:MAG: hypothetical protein SCH70_11010, partial [Candidatus Methanoperedens sp.]|nr:hypothetical protein [Candidatus Methanoperedens sp.]
ESQEYQLLGGEFWHKIGVCVYTFLYVLKKHEYNCCILLKYNKKNNLIENIDENIKYYQIGVIK